MVDPEAIKLFEDELDILIAKGHHCDLTFWDMFTVLLKRLVGLAVQCDAEYKARGGL